MLKYNGTFDERVNRFVPCMSTSASTEDYYKERVAYLERLVDFLEDSLKEYEGAIERVEDKGTVKVADIEPSDHWVAVCFDGILRGGPQTEKPPAELLDEYVEIPLVCGNCLISKLSKLTVHRVGTVTRLYSEDNPDSEYTVDMPYEEVRKLFTKKGV